MNHFVLKGKHIVLPSGVAAASILIVEGVIEAIGGYDADFDQSAINTIDMQEMVIMPGLVDVHVHINEPGRTEWEGFETATQAAAAGGVTTVIDMPLNSSPVTTTVESFQQKLEAADGKLAVDVAYHAGVVPDHAEQLDQVLSMGAIAGKAFMIDSGIDEFPFADRNALRAGMRVLKAHNKPLLAHGEVELGVNTPAPPWTRFNDYLASRPQAMETAAVKMLIELCQETGCAVHLVHLSATEPLEMLRAARAKGLPITVETSPHYLLLTAEEILDGRTEFKCAPPIREKANQAILKQALLNGDIDIVATDHSPCSPDLKKLETGDFSSAWGGISSLQYLLPIVWTAMKDDGATPADLARWLSANPAKIMGLQDRGTIEVGRKADLVCWSAERSFEVNPALTRHRHKLTPYNGRTLFGQVQMTMLGGKIIFQNGELKASDLGKSLMMIDS